MANRRYIVTGVNPAYGVEPGAVVTLDEDDEGVKLNVEGGVLVLATEAEKKGA